MDKKFKVVGIRNILKLHKIDWDLIDLESDVDDKLSFEENWNLIKEKYHITSFIELKERIENAR